LSDKERYDFDYEDEALKEWIQALRAAAPRTERALLLFNNCQRSQAAANAARIRALLAQFVPELEVIPAFDTPVEEPRQRLLFE
jgi:uncharacterized protein YecE (DUF72 family)